MRVVFVGAGNVATHLSAAMQQAGFVVVQVYSRTEVHARRLADVLHTDWTTEISAIINDADIYVFALKDSVLKDIIAQLNPNDGFWIHTAGSVPMDVFKGYARRYGVLYPLQTFSVDRAVDFRRIPCFTEASSPEDEALLQEVAGRLSDSVQPLSSEKRQYLHLAAVFAGNFTNHLYALAGKIVEEQDISPDVLLPLIDETAAKVHSLSPLKAQTGPAVRNDENVMSRHQAMLTDRAMNEIYRIISENILKEQFNYEQYKL
ncbi:MAG: DUF2520 domain-containing protein [Tannerella sp.]|jgi:predicted short-subunit dehydrogenase-like oxidoreductase (DUF2520 family)|nr:DUF2520 domain-containing protein [Tannerella sp.]